MGSLVCAVNGEKMLCVVLNNTDLNKMLGSKKERKTGKANTRVQCMVIIGILLSILFGLSGCSSVIESPEKGLPSIANIEGTLGLDVFFFDRPMEDMRVGEELWKNVDEQFMDMGQRLALEQNGFRVGLLGSQMPEELQSLLGLNGETEEPFPVSELAEVEQVSEALDDQNVMSPKMLSEGPWGRHIVLRRHMPYKIDAGGPYEQCSVLFRNYPHDTLSGKMFADARFLFQLEAIELDRNHVQLEVRPEVHHGLSRPRFANALVGGAPYGQTIEQFPNLTWKTSLSPGQMILITMQPERPESLGWHFFGQQSGDEFKQRLIVVRISRLSGPDPLRMALEN